MAKKEAEAKTVGRPQDDHHELVCPKCKMKYISINNRNTSNQLIPGIIQYKCKFADCNKTFYAVNGKYVLDDMTFDTVEEYCEYRRRFAINKILKLTKEVKNNVWDLNEHPKDNSGKSFVEEDVVNFIYQNKHDLKKINEKFAIYLDGK